MHFSMTVMCQGVKTEKVQSSFPNFVVLIRKKILHTRNNAKLIGKTIQQVLGNILNIEERCQVHGNCLVYRPVRPICASTRTSL